MEIGAVALYLNENGISQFEVVLESFLLVMQLVIDHFYVAYVSVVSFAATWTCLGGWLIASRLFDLLKCAQRGRTVRIERDRGVGAL